jgi:indolepyruvate ferredoxin oxidoreductase
MTVLDAPRVSSASRRQGVGQPQAVGDPRADNAVGSATQPTLKIDQRFACQGGFNVFTGNELLVKGCLETPGGVHLATGYPGSPVAQFFDVFAGLAPLLKRQGVRAFQAANEALSVAAVNGAQMAGCRAIAAFKSVGVHVASDALALGNLGGAHPDGGAVIVCGDDPWCDSTQVPADSRFLCEHLRMAVVEPGSPQELKDWVALSFELSRAAGLYVGYVVTTNQVDGGGSVAVRPNQFPELNMNQRTALDPATIDLDKVLLPPRTWQQELKMPERHAATVKAARRLGLNKLEDAVRPAVAGRAPLGFVTTGMAGQYLRHVLADLGLDGVFPILTMGMPYPTDVGLLSDLGRVADQMIVIEERRSFLEKNLRDRLFHELPHDEAIDLSRRLWGKRFPMEHGDDRPGIPETRGLNPSLLAQLLIPLIQRTRRVPADMRNGRLTGFLADLKATGKRKLDVLGATSAVMRDVSGEPVETVDTEEKLPARTPTFCPGCPHRDSSSLLLEVRRLFKDADYMRRKHKRGPVDLISHGDTGCYTMLMFAPTEQLMHNYSGMGLGGGTGSGIDSFLDPDRNRQIVFMGDGTFFHSGQVAISNAVAANQDLTFIILENGTTAMTGHQGHAATDSDLVGNPFPKQEIERVVRGMNGVSVDRADPADRAKWRKILEKRILSKGVKVVIADKECGITLHRRKKREEAKLAKERGFLPTKTHMNVTPEVCENCLECTKATACPGLVPADTDYGRKIDTDLTWCVNDGACERVQVTNEAANSVKPCPSFEQVKLVRTGKPRDPLAGLDLEHLPEPPIRSLPTDRAWRCHLTGVGGMGVGTVAAVLVTAAHHAGYRAIFNEKKGLAIRNGGVFAQIAWVEGTKGRRDEGAEGSEPASGRSSISHLAPQSLSPTTALIPYGQADLLLGIDVLEAARAVDPREPFRVATKGRTAAVLNLHKQATVYGLLGREDFDPVELKNRIDDRTDAARNYAKDLTAIAQKHLGSSQFVNVIALGVAFQLGHLPVPRAALERAIADMGRAKENLRAFALGRALALTPDALAGRPEPTTWEELLAHKLHLLRTHKSHGGSKKAAKFEELVRHGMKVMPNLPATAKYDLTVRIHDLLQWGGPKYAKQYLDAVRGIYRRDSADQRYEATVAAVWSVAKVMLIKDEPFVSYLLTRPEKKLRDAAKYNVDESAGDKLVYRHHTSPEFPIGPWRLRLKITTTDWQLNLARRMTLLRKLPGWHRRETEFRDWFLGLLPQLDLATEASYARGVEVLRAVEPVTGYREIRYPKQDAARERIGRLMASSPEASITQRPSRVAVGSV